VGDEPLRDAVIAGLLPLPVTSRAMFGGQGLYLEGTFFGVVFDGVLYFYTDDGSRAAYVERGMPALQPKYRPRGPKTVDRHFQVPDDVLANAAELREWALRAVESRRGVS
jgi:DNA transformation protein